MSTSGKMPRFTSHSALETIHATDQSPIDVP